MDSRGHIESAHSRALASLSLTRLKGACAWRAGCESAHAPHLSKPGSASRAAHRLDVAVARGVEEQEGLLRLHPAVLRVWSRLRSAVWGRAEQGAARMQAPSRRTRWKVRVISGSSAPAMSVCDRKQKMASTRTNSCGAAPVVARLCTLDRSPPCMGPTPNMASTRTKSCGGGLCARHALPGGQVAAGHGSTPGRDGPYPYPYPIKLGAGP